MRVFRLQSTLTRAALGTSSSWLRWCSTGEPREAGTSDATKNEKGNQEGTPKAREDASKSEKEIEDYKKQVEDLRKEVLYRAADAENARRIGREDVDKAKSFGITSFGKDMLEVVDTLEKGIEVFSAVPEAEIKANKNLDSFYTGVKLSVKVLLKNMGKHGIEKMNVSVGSPFDPNFHDAVVRTKPTEQIPHEHISLVLKDGYKLKGRVLRAAQVGVAHNDEN